MGGTDAPSRPRTRLFAKQAAKTGPQSLVEPDKFTWPQTGDWWERVVGTMLPARSLATLRCASTEMRDLVQNTKPQVALTVACWWFSNRIATGCIDNEIAIMPTLDIQRKTMQEFVESANESIPTPSSPWSTTVLAMRDWTRITYLNMSGLCGDGVSDLVGEERAKTCVVEVVQACLPHLNVLRLAGNCLDNEDMFSMTHGMLPLRRSPRSCRAVHLFSISATHLQVLDLSDNDLRDGAIYTLYRVLEPNSLVRELDLSDNIMIGSSGLNTLMSLLENCKLLETLKLTRWFKVNNWGALEQLQHNPRLRKLELRDCNLRGTGTKALSKALPHLPALRSLDVAYNLIAARGLEMILSTLSPSRSSLRLDVSYIILGDDGLGEI